MEKQLHYLPNVENGPHLLADNGINCRKNVFGYLKSSPLLFSYFRLKFLFLIFLNDCFCSYKHCFSDDTNKKKSRGEKSGDREGRSIGPLLPIHLFGNVTSKNSLTSREKCGGAPSC